MVGSKQSHACTSSPFLPRPVGSVARAKGELRGHSRAAPRHLSRAVRERGGDQWTRVGLAEKGIAFVAIAPKNPSLLLAADGKDTIYRSSDAGKTWNTVVLKVNSIVLLEFDPKNAEVAYAVVFVGRADMSQLQRSLDGGKTWQATPLEYPWRVIAFGGGNPSTVLTGNQGGPVGGLVKSADRGQTWQEASRKGVPDNYLVVTSLAVDPADPRSIVVMWDGKSTWSLFTSADGGATWTKVPPPGGQIPGLSQLIFGASGKTLYAVAKDDRAIRRSVVSLIAGSAERALHPL